MFKRMTYEEALAKVNQFPKRNKFGAKKTSVEGVVYDSRMEAEFASQLNLRLKAKDILRWERQKQIELYFFDSKGNKITSKKWKIDFLIYHKDGTKELAEVKGFETDDYRWKKNLLEKVWLRDNPDYIFKVYKRADI